MRRLVVSTAVIQSNDYNPPSNKYRTQLLERVIKENADSDIIVFPAGYFYDDVISKTKLFMSFSVEKTVSALLRKYRSSAVVCIGVDYRENAQRICLDQIAYAVNARGVIASGRKFYPTKVEKDFTVLATDFMSKERGKARTFQVNGFTCYLAVCYDGFGIRHLDIKNPDVDIVIDLVHSFFRRGRGPSGDVDFARKGFAGASMQWGCPVFGSAVFFERDIPANWPAGVMWSGADSVKSFRYSDNQMQWTDKSEVTGSKESSVVYKYIVSE